MKIDPKSIAWGGTTDRQLDTLYSLSKSLEANANVVEIGSAHGRSTIAIGQGLVEGNDGIVHAIDPHTHPVYPESEATLRRNISSAELHNINVIVDYSENVFPSFSEQIHMLWIDGSHKLTHVKKDIETFGELLSSGGIIALHDVGAFYGPTHAAITKILLKRRYGNVKTCGTLLYATVGGPQHISKLVTAAEIVARYIVSVVLKQLRSLQRGKK